MPELPEVETVVQGLALNIIGATIASVVVRCKKLRWPIPDNLDKILGQQTVRQVSRRGKYLLILTDVGTLIIHLGMSGKLCILTENLPVKKHDHMDIIFTNNLVLRYTDPRRFGAILMTTESAHEHPLIKSLGVEPLTHEFNAEYILQRASKRSIAIKPFLMDSKIVVGIGNIYATEALFIAGIHPKMSTGLLSHAQATKLVDAIKQTLQLAIEKGGTTLKDYVNSEGRPGYFSQQLKAYGRGGQPCVICDKTLQSCMLGQRNTVYCMYCQEY